MVNPDIKIVRQQVEELGAAAWTEGGVTRLSYSAAYRRAMELVTQYMHGAGMQVRVDAVGNIIGTYVGTEPALPSVMVGSHLDSVPQGGMLDGVLGVIGAIECVRCWHTVNWRGRRSVEVVATIEEEGTLFGVACLGASILAGEYADRSPDDFVDAAGRSLTWYLQQFGLDSTDLFKRAMLDPASIACFLELHIEQGEELVLADLPCGIVTDIIWIDRTWIAIDGVANHAGTTRMDRRQDALLAAAAVVTEVNRQAVASEGKFVTTVGSLEVSPGSTNVIPGRVVLSVEARGANAPELELARQGLQECLAEIEHRFCVKTAVIKHHYLDSAPMDKTIINVLRAAAVETNVKYRELPSWAGHDAKVMAGVVPTGMLFVPSVNGISHSPEESTIWEQVGEGLKVLNQALKMLST